MPLTGKIAPAAVELLRTLQQHGYQAYIVGGAVRDLLLGMQPKDYDLATSAKPEEVRRIFGRSARIIGRRFRLVHVYRDRHCFEVSTFRRKPSAEERQGREDDDGIMLWRDNEFGTLEEDAARRDFTINAMYFDAVGKDGIIDFTNGQSDLRAGLIRTIGDPEERMLEDPVRMFRACGLAARYGLKLDPSLASAVAKLAPNIQLSSRARLFEELLKMFARAGAAGTLGAAQELGLLQHFWPAPAAFWSGPAGRLFQRLLECRDARIRGGGYSNSRALALATAAFPAFLATRPDGAVLTERQEELEVWEFKSGLERDCRDCVNSFFAPYPVPRELSARTRDIILMQARLRHNINPRRLARHPDYPYAYELFSLLTEICSWSAEALEAIPRPEKRNRASAEAGESAAFAKPGRRRRPRPRRRRPDKEADGT